MTEIYLDNNATTKVAPEILKAMTPFFTDHYGNAGSAHQAGLIADRAVFESRNLILKTLQANAHKVIFTAGGTEGDNLAIFGTVRSLKNKGNHIVTTSVEHAAVLESMKILYKDEFEVSYVNPREDGTVHAEDITNAMRDETILVSVMHINNETGAIFPVEEIARAVKAKKPDCIFHSDGVQAIGKVKPDLSQIDLYSISGHKFHAPKGVGALIIREGTPIFRINYGGGQEWGLRSGTENVAGIVGLAKALELSYKDFDKKLKHYIDLRVTLLKELNSINNASINSPEISTPQTLNISFVGVPGEALVNGLSEQGIYVGTGSACTQKRRGRSHVLTALGFSGERINSSIRFSFSRYTTKKEINDVAKILKDLVPKLKKSA